MNWQEYRDEVKRTMPPENTPLQRCVYALGLVGEVAEYWDDPTIDEAGDVLWYREALGECYGLEPGLGWSEYSADDIRAMAGRVAEAVKKVEGHDRQDLMPRLVDQLKYFYSALRYDYCQSLESVMEHNVKKLRERWPNGFVRGVR